MLKFIQLRDANLICGSFTDKNDTNNNMQKIQLLKDNEQKEGQDKNPTMLATSMVTIIHQGESLWITFHPDQWWPDSDFYRHNGAGQAGPC